MEEGLLELDEEVLLQGGQEAGQLVLPQGTLEDGTNTVQALRWGYRTWASFFNDAGFCASYLAVIQFIASMPADSSTA